MEAARLQDVSVASAATGAGAIASAARAAAATRHPWTLAGISVDGAGIATERATIAGD
jgi:hypothetical protein